MRAEGWAERSAARRNKRRAERFPLLALTGQLEQVTPEQLRFAWEARQQAWARFERYQERQGRLYRFLVALRVSEAELAELDCRRGACPSSSAYSADFWHCMLRALVRGEKSQKESK